MSEEEHPTAPEEPRRCNNCGNVYWLLTRHCPECGSEDTEFVPEEELDKEDKRKDVTLRKCNICGNKEKGWLSIKKHLMEDHSLNERLEALTENIHPSPG